mmetsp:Transcript_35239/g.88806  ORF Transcript_35239/g.88806 Transcript_35239/m.88806 type:complete len:210 (+) Transcript_35239:681-1310(+)
MAAGPRANEGGTKPTEAGDITDGATWAEAGMTAEASKGCAVLAWATGEAPFIRSTCNALAMPSSGSAEASSFSSLAFSMATASTTASSFCAGSAGSDDVDDIEETVDDFRFRTPLLETLPFLLGMSLWANMQHIVTIPKSAAMAPTRHVTGCSDKKSPVGATAAAERLATGTVTRSVGTASNNASGDVELDVVAVVVLTVNVMAGSGST